MDKKVKNMLEAWKNKLLDTGNRNQAINFKDLKRSSIKVIHPNRVDFLDWIQSDKLEFINLFSKSFIEQEEIRNINDEFVEDRYYTHGIEYKPKDTYTYKELKPVIEKFNNSLRGNNKTKYLITDSSYKKEYAALSNISRRARLFEEENAINILHFAIGFLNRYESEDSYVVIRSPLAFIQVDLKRDSLDSPYITSIKENEILINDTLVNKMHNEFGINLDFDFDQGKDFNENYDDYKSFVENEIKDYHRWHITDDINLGVFSFSKINMVKDLEENEERILSNSNIRLLSGDIESYEDVSEFYTEDELDDRIIPEELFQVLDADSSQALAIEAAIKGNSFVMQGPPGTGKSKQYAGDIYIGGTHPAASGGAYMTAIYGFCSLKHFKNSISVKANLPSNIKSINFKTINNNKLYDVKVNKVNTYIEEIRNV